MGVRTYLSLFKLRELLKDYPFRVLDYAFTKNGISDSVYIIFSEDRKYLFKLYENSSLAEIEREISLLKHISSLPVPKVIADKRGEEITPFGDKFFVIYSFIEGEIVKNIKEIHLKEIGEFFGKFHSQSKNLFHERRVDLDKVRDLLKYVDRDDIDKFLPIFLKIKDLKISMDGVIHSDLFSDNAKFSSSGELCGVFDFSDAALGDFGFDLGVCAASWCFVNNEMDLDLIETLLRSYNAFSPKKFDLKSLKNYTVLALLYYALSRYKAKKEKREGVRDYRELLNRAVSLI